MKNKKLKVDGTAVRIDFQNEEDWINLTDVAKRNSKGRPIDKIKNWLRNRRTLEYLEAFEELHNPNFKVDQMIHFKNDAAKNRLDISLDDFIKRTDAKFVRIKRGRYGGTWVVFEIAVNFMNWLSPKFEVHFNKEFKRMKKSELETASMIEKKTDRWLLQKIEDSALEANQLARDLGERLEKKIDKT